jgi:hypothetical protein
MEEGGFFQAMKNKLLLVGTFHGEDKQATINISTQEGEE